MDFLRNPELRRRMKSEAKVEEERDVRVTESSETV